MSPACPCSPASPTVYLNDGTGHFTSAGTFGDPGDIITPFVESGRTFENRNPVNGELVNLVREADASAVDDAVKAARRALRGPWGRMSEQERAALLRKVADGIMRRFDEFLAAEVRDTGKPASLASHIDIPRGAANFNVFADQILVDPLTRQLVRDLGDNDVPKRLAVTVPTARRWPSGTVTGGG